MNAEHATRLIRATHKLAELGLHPDYAGLHLLKNLDRIATVDPEHVAVEIFEAAPDSWKSDLPAEDEAQAADRAAEAGREMARRQRASGTDSDLAFR